MIPFSYRVCGLAEARPIVASKWPTDILSVMPHPDYPTPAGIRHDAVAFDDITTPIAGLIQPRMEHLQAALKLTANLSDGDRFLIHCEHGQSRSTSVLIAILIQHGMEPENAFKAVEAIRPQLLPNVRIIRFTDEHFGLDGRLVGFYDRWRAARGYGTVAQAETLSDGGKRVLDVLARCWTQ